MRNYFTASFGKSFGPSAKLIAITLLCAALTACNDGGGGSPPAQTTSPPVSGTLQVVAGQKFGYPYGVVVGPSGNLFVGSAVASPIVEVAPDGTITPLPLTYYDFRTPATTPANSFLSVGGMARDAAGNLFVVDRTASVIRKVAPDGTNTVFAGTLSTNGSTDGPATAALFNQPNGITLSVDGNFYIADTGNSTIRKMTPAGVVTTVAGTAKVQGHTDGAGNAATFFQPYALTSDSTGNLYVADTQNCLIRKIALDGTVSTVAGQPLFAGTYDATGAGALFYFPYGITADSASNLYVADAGEIRKITPAGVVTTVVGTGLTPGGIVLSGIPQPGPLPGELDTLAIGVAVIDSHTLAVTTTDSLYKVTFN